MMTESVPDVHRLHREAFEQFVLEQAEPWHRTHLTALYEAWHTYNRRYFEGKMTPPYILLSETGIPRAYGDTSPATGFGAHLQIRLRPSLLRGTHPHIQKGNHDRCGVERFVQDILLHETIHQYQIEVLKKNEASYDGHGPLFRDSANKIGAALGLPPVRPSKVPKKERKLPSCAQWPHNVRPDDYYCGAIRHVWKVVIPTEEGLFRELTKLTRSVDKATLERLCARILANKNREETSSHD
jgi:hypothetical protein